MGKILRISFKLNFTPNTLSCYGLRHWMGGYIKCAALGHHPQRMNKINTNIRHSFAKYTEYYPSVMALIYLCRLHIEQPPFSGWAILQIPPTCLYLFFLSTRSSFQNKNVEFRLALQNLSLFRDKRSFSLKRFSVNLSLYSTYSQEWNALDIRF